jgi:hypothetical protein
LQRKKRHAAANRDIARHLLRLGFIEIAPPLVPRGPKGLVAFTGVLPGTRTPFRIRIDILDWDFVDQPRIKLLDEPDGFRPHVDDQCCLCYLQQSAVVFDRHDAIGNLTYCLNQAAQELERQASVGYRHEESRYEFIRFWGDHGCYLRGTVRPQQRLHRTCFTWYGAGRILFSDDKLEIARLGRSLHQGMARKEHEKQSLPAWVITLDKDPWLTRNGPPKTWEDLWDWLAMVDPRSRDCLASLVDKKEFAEAYHHAVVFWHGDNWFGVETSLGEKVRRTYSLNRLARHNGRAALAQHLRTGGGAKLKLTTFATIDVTPEFIHARNLGAGNSLAGKRIHLVGAGAIGGFIAQQLACLGAGAGGGELLIVDRDILNSENLGRHFLGMEKVLHDKATAVAEVLSAQFPMSNIRGLVTDARAVPHLFDCNLIVDATGEEGLSLVLNELHQERLAVDTEAPAMLFAWVLGNGEVVQALLSDGGNHACYDCLNLPEAEDAISRQRYKVLKQPPETRFVGCHTMRPYAVTAPSMAASLAAQMVADWNLGHPSPRFRTIYLATGANLYHRSKTEADPDKLRRCRTCAET